MTKAVNRLKVVLVEQKKTGKWLADYVKRVNLFIKRNSWQQVSIFSLCGLFVTVIFIFIECVFFSFYRS